MPKKVQLLGRSARNQSSKNKMVCFGNANLRVLLLPYLPLGTLVQQLACMEDGIPGAQRNRSVLFAGLELAPVLRFPIFSLIASRCSPVGWM